MESAQGRLAAHRDHNRDERGQNKDCDRDDKWPHAVAHLSPGEMIAPSFTLQEDLPKGYQRADSQADLGQAEVKLTRAEDENGLRSQVVIGQRQWHERQGERQAIPA